MIIEPAPDLREAMLQALRDEYMTDRLRPGLHMSSLIYCLTKTYWDHHDPEPPTEREVALWSIGYAMERVMIHRLGVEPLVVDGIHMTPDFKLMEVADLKTTRKAPTISNGCDVCGEPFRGHTAAKMGHAYVATSMPFQFPMGWKRQFMAYRYGLNQRCRCGHDKKDHATESWGECWGDASTSSSNPGIPGYQCHCRKFETAPVLAFDVVVMHLIQAELTTWRVYFTPQELEDNWTWILQRANDLESMNAGQNPMPFQHLGFPGECNNCRYKLRCELTASLAGYQKPQLRLVETEMEEEI